MDSQILLDKAKIASEHHSDEPCDRLAFRVGYLETTIKQLCNILDESKSIMDRQRELIEEMKKGYSTDL